MRESIVCIGRVGKNPYRFPETGICISSYEELCYYLSGHMLCYLYTLPEEELLYYIRDELGLEKLFRQLSKYTDAQRDQMKYFAALFREGNYFSEEEIHQILDEYRQLKNTPYALQCKWTGDLFLQAGRAAMAVHYYKEALKTGTLESVETGAVYHNMAAAKSRLFRFHDAKIDFVKAYRYGGDEESLFCYYGLTALTEGLDKAKKELESFKISDILMENFENRFAGMKDEFEYSTQAAKKERIAYLMSHEKTEEAQEMYRKFVEELRRDFRQQLDMEDNLPMVNLPVPAEN